MIVDSSMLNRLSILGCIYCKLKYSRERNKQAPHNAPLLTGLEIFGCVLESRIRWSSRVARELEDQFPNSGNDGSGSCDHYPSEAGELWFPAEHSPCKEILHSLQTL